ncbi:MAG: NAD-dependent epimerase/dehydratase family protein, partial [Methylomonas sp.]
MKRALVTGANGFIGQYLCQFLNEQNYEIRALSRHAQSQWPDEVALDFSSVQWSINPCKEIDTIFHLAGKAHALAENYQDANEYHQINTEGTRKLLEAAQEAGVKRFI